MFLTQKDKKVLYLFYIFTIFFEIIHISIDNLPPSGLRLLYIILFSTFCITRRNFAPAFIASSLVIERTSISFGGYMPEGFWYYSLILIYCLISQHYKSHLYSNVNKVYIVITAFTVYSFFNSVVFDSFTFFSSLFFLLLYFNCINKRPQYIGIIVQFIIYTTSFVCITSFFNYDRLTSANAELVSNISENVQRFEWKDGNYLSFIYGMSFLFSLYILIFKRNCGILGYLCSLSLIISIIMTISRGTILALLISLLFYFKKEIFSFKYTKYVLLSLLTLYIIYSLGLFDAVIQRFTGEEIESGSGRTEIWGLGILKFFNLDFINQLIGVGFEEGSRFVAFFGIMWSAHNNYLEIMYSLGYIGLFLFALMIFYLYSHNTKENKTLLIFILTNSLFIVPFTYDLPLFAVLGIIMTKYHFKDLLI